MPGLNDFLDQYKQQMRPAVDASASDGVDDNSAATIKQTVDTRLAREQDDFAKGQVQGAKDAARAATTQMKEQGFTPVHNPDTGAVEPLKAPNGQAVRRQPNTDLHYDQDGNIYRHDPVNGGLAPAVGVKKTDKATGNILEHFGHNVSRVVGVDDAQVQRNKDTSLLNDATKVVQDTRREFDPREVTRSHAKAKTDLKAAQEAHDADPSRENLTALDAATDTFNNLDRQKKAVSQYYGDTSQIRAHRAAVAAGTLTDKDRQHWQDLLDSKKAGPPTPVPAEQQRMMDMKGDGPPPPKTNAQMAKDFGLKSVDRPADVEFPPEQPAAPTLPKVPAAAAAPVAPAIPPPPSTNPGSSGQAARANAATGAEQAAPATALLSAPALNAAPPAPPTAPPPPVAPVAPVQPSAPVAPPAQAAPNMPGQPPQGAGAPMSSALFPQGAAPTVADPEAIKSLPLDQAHAAIQQSSSAIDAQATVLQQKQAEIHAPLTEVEGRMQQWNSINAASIANGDPVEQMQFEDGTPAPPIAAHLKSKIQDLYAEHRDVAKKIQPALDELAGSQAAHQADIDKHNASVAALNQKVDEQKQADEEQRLEGLATLRADTKTAPFADQLDALHGETTKGIEDINSQYPEGPTREAALKALQDQQSKKGDAINQSLDEAANPAKKIEHDQYIADLVSGMDGASRSHLRNDAAKELGMSRSDLESVVDRVKTRKYSIDDNGGIQFSGYGSETTPTPDELLSSIDQAERDGVLNSAKVPELKAKAQKAKDDYDAIVQAAGGAAELKAVLRGVGKGGAFLAGSAPGAKIGATLGAMVPGVGETGISEAVGAVIGALATGTAASWGYDETLKKLGSYFDAVDSVNKSAELHPGYAGAGELASFVAAPTKILSKAAWGEGASEALKPAVLQSIENYKKLANVAADSVGDAGASAAVDAARSTASMNAVLKAGGSAAGGAALFTAGQYAFDAARYSIADSLGIKHEELKSPTLSDLATNTGLALLLHGQGLAFKDYTPRDVASILTRAQMHKNAGRGYGVEGDPADILKAYEDAGVDTKGWSEAQKKEMTAPLSPEEISVYKNAEKKTKELRDAGATDAEFGGAQQASIPGMFGKSTPIASAVVKAKGDGGKPPEKGLPSPITPEVKTAASDAELSSADPADPDVARANVLRDIGQGVKVEDMTEGELNAVGLTRPQGSDKVKALTKDAAGNPITPAIHVDGKGNAIILQPALDTLKAKFPATAGLVGMSEKEARTHFNSPPAEEKTDSQKATEAQAAGKTFTNMPKDDVLRMSDDELQKEFDDIQRVHAVVGVADEKLARAGEIQAELTRRKVQNAPATVEHADALEKAADTLEKAGKSHNVAPLRKEAEAIRQQAATNPVKTELKPGDGVRKWAADQIVKAATPELAQQAEKSPAAGKLKLIATALDKYGSTFNGIEVGPTTGTEGLEYQPDTGALHIDPKKFLAHLDKVGGSSTASVSKEIANSLLHEKDHRLSTLLDNGPDGKPTATTDPEFAADLDAMWKSIPDSVKTAQIAAYFKDTKAKFPSDWHAKHEWWADVSAKLGRGEMPQSLDNADLWPKLKKLIKSYVAALERWLAKAPQEIKDRFARTLAKLKALEAKLESGGLESKTLEPTAIENNRAKREEKLAKPKEVDANKVSANEEDMNYSPPPAPPPANAALVAPAPEPPSAPLVAETVKTLADTGETLFPMPPKGRSLEGMRDAVRKRLDVLTKEFDDESEPMSDERATVVESGVKRLTALLGKIEAKMGGENLVAGNARALEGKAKAAEVLNQQQQDDASSAINQRLAERNAAIEAANKDDWAVRRFTEKATKKGRQDFSGWEVVKNGERKKYGFSNDAEATNWMLAVHKREPERERQAVEYRAEQEAKKAAEPAPSPAVVENREKAAVKRTVTTGWKLGDGVKTANGIHVVTREPSASGTMQITNEHGSSLPAVAKSAEKIEVPRELQDKILGRAIAEHNEKAEKAFFKNGKLKAGISAEHAAELNENGKRLLGWQKEHAATPEVPAEPAPEPAKLSEPEKPPDKAINRREEMKVAGVSSLAALEKVKLGSVDTPTQGHLNNGRQIKADAWKRVKALREKVKNAGLHAGNFRVVLLQAEIAHKEAIRMEEGALKAIEKRANELGKTTLSLPPATPKDDADYMDAVNRGDTETAQRMVDEAAKRTGYGIKAFHGSPHGEFSTFDSSKASDWYPDRSADDDHGNYSEGTHWFSSEKSIAQGYAAGLYTRGAGEYLLKGIPVEQRPLPEGTRVKFFPGHGASSIYLTPEQVKNDQLPPSALTPSGRLKRGAQLVVELPNKQSIGGAAFINSNEGKEPSSPQLALKLAHKFYNHDIPQRTTSSTLGVLLKMENPKTVDMEGGLFSRMGRKADKAMAEGHDGLIIKNVIDPGSNPLRAESATTYAVFDPSQIKSADPITRDSSGNVIPLSERFNPESNSILHLPPTSPEQDDAYAAHKEFAETYGLTPLSRADFDRIEQDKAAEANGTPNYDPGTTVAPSEMPPDTTGLRRSYLDPLYANEDWVNFKAGETRTFRESVWPDALREVGKNPEAGRQLVDDLLKSPRALDDTEYGVLLHEFLTRRISYEAAMEGVTAAKDPVAKQLADQRVARTRDAYFLAGEATKLAKRKNGQGLNAIRMALKDDFTLGKLLYTQTSMKGAPLDEAEEKEVKDLHAKYEAATKASEEKQAEIAELNGALDVLRRAAHNQVQIPVAEKLLSKEGKDALARLKAKKGLSLPPLNAPPAANDDFQDLSIFGASLIEGGADSFDAFKSAIDKELPGALDGLDANAVYEAAKQHLKSAQTKAVRDKTPSGNTDRIKTKRATSADLTTDDLNRLALSLVQHEKISTVKELVDRIHAVVEDVFPGITRKEVARVWTNLENPSIPNQDPAHKTVRDLKRQEAAILKREIVEVEKRRPDKGGPQRDNPSDLARKYERELSDALRNSKLKPASGPMQMKSAQDRLETALTHRRDDLKRMVAAKKRDVRTTTPTAETPKMAALRKEIEALDRKLQLVDPKNTGMTDAQRVKLMENAAVKSIASLTTEIADLDKLIKANSTAGAPVKAKPPTGPTSPTLDALRKERDAKWEQRDEMRNTLDDMHDLANPVDPVKAMLDRLNIRQNKATVPLPPRVRSHLERLTKANLKQPTLTFVADAMKFGMSQSDAEHAQIILDAEYERRERFALRGYKRRIQRSIAHAEMKEQAFDADNPLLKKTPAQLTLDDEARKLDNELLIAKRNVIRAQERMSIRRRTWDKKLGLEISRYSRAFLLFDYVVLAKLGSAAAVRTILTPVEDAIGGSLVNAALPGLRDASARYGPFSLAGEKSALTFRPETEAAARSITDTFKTLVNEIGSTLKTGLSSIDLKYGKNSDFHDLDPHITDFIGNIHAAIKVLPKLNEFWRSFQMRVEKGIRLGKDVSSPAAIMMIGTAAYQDALRAIYQQDNALSKVWSGILQNLDNPKYPIIAKNPKMAAALANAMRIGVPITKVPTNMFLETFGSYIFGLPRGLLEISPHAWRAAAGGQGVERVTQAWSRLQDILRKLPEDQADDVNRHFRKGLPGAAITLLVMYGGAVAASIVGGLWTASQHAKDKKDPLARRADHFYMPDGTPIPHFATHAGVFLTASFAKTLRNYFESGNKTNSENIAKTEKELEKAEASLKKATTTNQVNKAKAAINAATQSLAALKANPSAKNMGLGSSLIYSSIALGNTLPFVGNIAQALDASKDTSRGNYLASELGASRLVPQGLKNWAEAQDTDENGEPVDRVKKTFLDHIKNRMPWMRQTLPRKEGETDTFGFPANIPHTPIPAETALKNLKAVHPEAPYKIPGISPEVLQKLPDDETRKAFVAKTGEVLRRMTTQGIPRTRNPVTGLTPYEIDHPTYETGAKFDAYHRAAEAEAKEFIANPANVRQYSEKLKSYRSTLVKP